MGVTVMAWRMEVGLVGRKYCTLSICGVVLHGGNRPLVLYDGDTRLQLLVVIDSNVTFNTSINPRVDGIMLFRMERSFYIFLQGSYIYFSFHLLGNFFRRPADRSPDKESQSTITNSQS